MSTHGNGIARRVDAGPFINWLKGLEDRYDSHSALGRHLGLDQTTVTRFIEGRYAQVQETIVDRALVANGDVHLYHELCPPPPDEDCVIRRAERAVQNGSVLCQIGVESQGRREEVLEEARALRAEARRAQSNARKIREATRRARVVPGVA